MFCGMFRTEDLLLYKRNETLQDVALLETNQPHGGMSDRAESQHSDVDYFSPTARRTQCFVLFLTWRTLSTLSM